MAFIISLSLFKINLFTSKQLKVLFELFNYLLKKTYIDIVRLMYFGDYKYSKYRLKTTLLEHICIYIYIYIYVNILSKKLICIYLYIYQLTSNDSIVFLKQVLSYNFTMKP